MFGNIRRKLNNVFQDSFNLTTTSTTTTTTTSISRSGDNNKNSLFKFNSIINADQNKLLTNNVSTKNINVNAGCHLLALYEKHWQEIHKLNEDNAIEAYEIDKLICNLNENSKRKSIAISDLNQSLVTLPTVTTTLDTCFQMVCDIEKSVILVEQKLIEFEDLIDVLELQEHQLNHRFEMAMYKEKKLGNLEQVRQKLADKHAISVKQYENQLRSVQQERQAVFQDAFQNDLNYYKESGSIPKVEHISTQSELTLEEIVLNNNRSDTKELDEFLNN